MANPTDVADAASQVLDATQEPVVRLRLLRDVLARLANIETYSQVLQRSTRLSRYVFSPMRSV
jgi:hypothetical protein